MGFGIGEAVKEMYGGAAVRRAGWNGKGMWLTLVSPSLPLALAVSQGVGIQEGMRPVLPFVVMRTATGELVPWLCSQTDLLAGDWELVPTAERI